MWGSEGGGIITASIVSLGGNDWGPERKQVCGSLGRVGILFLFHLSGCCREVSEEILKKSPRYVSKMYLQNTSQVVEVPSGSFC